MSETRNGGQASSRSDPRVPPTESVLGRGYERFAASVGASLVSLTMYVMGKSSSVSQRTVVFSLLNCHITANSHLSHYTNLQNLTLVNAIGCPGGGWPQVCSMLRELRSPHIQCLRIYGMKMCGDPEGGCQCEAQPAGGLLCLLAGSGIDELDAVLGAEVFRHLAEVCLSFGRQHSSGPRTAPRELAQRVRSLVRPSLPKLHARGVIMISI